MVQKPQFSCWVSEDQIPGNHRVLSFFGVVWGSVKFHRKLFIRFFFGWLSRYRTSYYRHYQVSAQPSPCCSTFGLVVQAHDLFITDDHSPVLQDGAPEAYYKWIYPWLYPFTTMVNRVCWGYNYLITRGAPSCTFNQFLFGSKFPCSSLRDFDLLKQRPGGFLQKRGPSFFRGKS